MQPPLLRPPRHRRSRHRRRQIDGRIVVVAAFAFMAAVSWVADDGAGYADPAPPMNVEGGHYMCIEWFEGRFIQIKCR